MCIEQKKNKMLQLKLKILEQEQRSNQRLLDERRLFNNIVLQGGGSFFDFFSSPSCPDKSDTAVQALEQRLKELETSQKEELEQKDKEIEKWRKENRSLRAAQKTTEEVARKKNDMGEVTVQRTPAGTYMTDCLFTLLHELLLTVCHIINNGKYSEYDSKDLLGSKIQTYFLNKEPLLKGNVGARKTIRETLENVMLEAEDKFDLNYIKSIRKTLIETMASVRTVYVPTDKKIIDIVELHKNLFPEKRRLFEQYERWNNQTAEAIDAMYDDEGLCPQV